MEWDEQLDADARRAFTSHWIDAVTMGFLRSSEDAWCSRLSSDFQSVREAVPSIHPLEETEFRRILRALSQTEPFALRDDKPFLFIRLSPQTVIYDFSS